MKKDLLEKLLNESIVTGANFADVFYEEKREKNIILLDSKIDKVTINSLKGAGIRICDNDNVYYSAVNDLSEDNLLNVIKEMRSNIKKEPTIKEIKLKDQKIKYPKFEMSHEEVSDEFKKNYLLNVDKIARGLDKRITQVNAYFFESKQNVVIANTKNKLVKDTRYLTRFVTVVYALENGKRTQSSFSSGSNEGYAFLNNIDIEKEIKNLVDVTIKKLHAPYAPCGKIPVIVGTGFGVLIHEACGHALEATSVADNISVLSGKMGKKVASDIVSIGDDGTIPGLFGTVNIDDEGNLPRNNILIENGILKSYLVDEVNSPKMNHKVTGSGRRESYYLAPTSRMNNTYLMKGNSTLEEMLSTIDYGLYAKVMGGGTVDPITGDFNFGVNEAYIIRNGKIEEMVVGASLIGNTKEILNNIEMISDDLEFDTGYCGSISGYVPVTCGEPTLKLSSILVGGKNE